MTVAMKRNHLLITTSDAGVDGPMTAVNGIGRADRQRALNLARRAAEQHQRVYITEVRVAESRIIKAFYCGRED